MELQPTFNANELNASGFATVSFGSDAVLNVHFFPKPVLDKLESVRQGKSVHKSVPFVRIQQPGERDFVERPASELDKQRFARQWQQFSQNVTPVPDGTMVEHLFPQNPEVPMTLHSRGVHTVEQLANLGAEAISRVGLGAQDWVNQAKRYLETAAKGAGFHQMKQQIDRLAEDNEELKRTLSLLRQQNAQQAQQMAAFMQQQTQGNPNRIPMPMPGQDEIERNSRRAMGDLVIPGMQSVESMAADDDGYIPMPTADEAQSYSYEEPVTNLDAPTDVRRGPGRPRKTP